MAWLGLDRLITGYDLDEEQQRSDSLDAAIALQNRERVQRGIWTEEQYNQAQTNILRGNESTGANDVVGSVGSEFRSGLQDGLNNVTGTIHDTLAGTVGAIFRSIPVSVWLIGAVALFVYLGGLDFARRKLAKA